MTSLTHLETGDVVGVIMDEAQRVTDGGIVVTNDEAVLRREDHRTATVYSAPEHYTHVRNRDQKRIEIRTKCPVAVGDRVIVQRYAGVGTTEVEGQTITLVRIHEIIGLIEE